MKTSLKVLLQSGEGQYIEYKSCFDRTKNRPQKQRTLKSMAKDVAICLAEMANADGGTLLVGVENDGKVSGCPYAKEQLDSIKKMASDSWKKPVPFLFEIADHTNGSIAVFEVDAQADVFTMTDGRTPYRNHENTTWLSGEDVRALRKGKGNTLFERSITSFTMNDLDKSLLQRFHENFGAPSSKSYQDLLVEHDLAVRSGTETKLTLAACLLFGKPPMTRFHERCGINFRRFAGIVALTGARNNERIDKTIEAPLPLLIEQTFHLINTQIGMSRKLHDLFFEERPEYPAFAWQEALINAVVHRDYSLRGNEIEVQMFDDRLETKNPGLPPEPVTIKELQERKMVHASRNPRIMRVMKAFGFVRERGEGLQRVFEETEESLLPLPEISAVGRFFKIVLRNTPIFDEETMTWLEGFPLEKINIHQRRILAHCYQSGKGYFVLRDYTQQNKVTKEVAKKAIKQMLEKGIIEVVGQRKGARYYPLLQRGTIEDRLREYFSRHDVLTNREYRRIAGDVHIATASTQLRSLVKAGLLTRKGQKRGTRYYPGPNLLKTK